MAKIKKQFRVSNFTNIVLQYLADQCDTNQTDILEKSVYKFALDLLDEDTLNDLLRLAKDVE